METTSLLNLPQRLEANIGKKYPGVWKVIDTVRAMKGTEVPDWNDAVFLPYAAWYAITCNVLGKPGLGVEDTLILNEIAFAGTWKARQNFIEVDPAALEQAEKEPFSGNLPASLLWQLPRWCVYVDVHVNTYNVWWQGFMAMLEEDANDRHRELRLLFLDKNGKGFPFMLHIGNWSLDDAYQRMIEDANLTAQTLEMGEINDKGKFVLPGMRLVLSLLIDICSKGGKS